VRDAEVSKLGRATGVEEDVGRLDVAVDHAAMMRGLEPADDVERHAPDLGAGQLLTGGEARGERSASEILHRQKAALDRYVVDLDERWVAQRAREPGLAHEPLVGSAAARARREEHLERDRATGDLVGGEEHASRRAGADQAIEPVAAGDHLAIA
jgi:hypothetical protein